MIGKPGHIQRCWELKSAFVCVALIVQVMRLDPWSKYYAHCCSVCHTCIACYLQRVGPVLGASHDLPELAVHLVKGPVLSRQLLLDVLRTEDGLQIHPALLNLQWQDAKHQW